MLTVDGQIQNTCVHICITGTTRRWSEVDSYNPSMM
jgi:hypothetical protein